MLDVLSFLFWEPWLRVFCKQLLLRVLTEAPPGYGRTAGEGQGRGVRFIKEVVLKALAPYDPLLRNWVGGFAFPDY